jgi:hypothetical protein
MESQCLVDVKIFIKIQNQFNHFLNVFALFNMLWHICFIHKYTLPSHHMN